MAHTRGRRPHVVILGGGFGGLAAARALGRTPVDVTIVDRRNYHLFQPLLYQVATASLSAPEVSSPLRKLLRDQRNTRVILGEVERVDPGRKEIHLDGGDILDYDWCISSLGSTHHYFGHDGWASHAPALKSVEDALDVRRRVLLAFEHAERERDPRKRAAWLTFVVIGAGPTGVELSGALVELARHTLRPEYRSFDPADARVVLLEAMDRVLPPLHPELSRMARHQLEEKGVEVHTGAMVKGVDGDGVTFGDDERIDARTVLWAAGVKAAPVELGVETDKKGKVPVGEDLAAPGHPSLFVIGDQALFEQAGAPVPDVAQKALQMGRHAVDCIQRDIAGRPRKPFQFDDKGYMVVIGRNAAVADTGRRRIGGFGAWVAWLVVHLWKLMGFRNKAFVFLDWAYAYVTHRRNARIAIPSAAPENTGLTRARAGSSEAAEGAGTEDAASDPAKPTSEAREAPGGDREARGGERREGRDSGQGRQNGHRRGGKGAPAG